MSHPHSHHEHTHRQEASCCTKLVEAPVQAASPNCCGGQQAQTTHAHHAHRHGAHAAKAAAVSSDPNAIYTCPMHPEIRQVGPGSCPLCGMALEPVAITLEEQANPELDDMTRRFWLSLLLSVPLLVITMGHMIPA